MIRHLRLFTLPLLVSARALAVVPDAGPMVGHVTDNSARLWMQFPIAGDVTVNAYDVAKGVAVSGVRVGLEGPSPFVCDIPISGLQPNRTYRVEVKFDGDPVKLPGPELTLRTTPSPGDEATFTVGFGGGIAIAPMAGAAATRPDTPFVPAGGHKIPVFNAVDTVKPRAFLFLGDTGTLPARADQYPQTHRAAYRFIADFHSAMRKEPDLQELFRSTACYSVYGEHDFGPGGPAADFPFVQESLIAYQRFWPNPDWGTPASPGCFSTFTFGDVDFFLLDARTFRTAPDASGKMLGDAQIAWLEKNLQASKAAFKILAAPCVLWGDDPQKPDADSWSRYPAEQEAFMKWLGQNRIDGVVAVAGGLPVGQLTRLAPAPGGVNYPLFAMSSSALLSAGRPAAEPGLDPRRVGQAVTADTFGTLDFAGQHEHRFVTLKLRDASGKTRVEQTLLAVNLHN